MHLKVFFFSSGVIKRFSFEISYSVDPLRSLLLQGRLLPVDCDPSLWKCTILDQVHFDCVHHKVTCIFIDGEVQLLPMDLKCANRLLAAVAKLTQVGIEPMALSGASMGAGSPRGNPFFFSSSSSSSPAAGRSPLSFFSAAGNRSAGQGNGNGKGMGGGNSNSSGIQSGSNGGVNGGSGGRRQPQQQQQPGTRKPELPTAGALETSGHKATSTLISFSSPASTSSTSSSSSSSSSPIASTSASSSSSKPKLSQSDSLEDTSSEDRELKVIGSVTPETSPTKPAGRKLALSKSGDLSVITAAISSALSIDLGDRGSSKSVPSSPAAFPLDSPSGNLSVPASPVFSSNPATPLSSQTPFSNSRFAVPRQNAKTNNPNYYYAKIRSEVLDVFQRHILQNLNLPQNSALWSAESSLNKQERKLQEMDTELDKQTKTVQEKKQKLKDLRTKFITEVELDDTALHKAGPVYLDVILEGVEQDVVETNKELMVSQSTVDRTKTRLDFCRTVFQEQQQQQPQWGEQANPNVAAVGSTTEVNEEEDPASPRSPLVPLVTPELLASLEETLERGRKERDLHWKRATMLIEAREKCKYELRMRKKDSDRDLLTFCEINSTEYQYLAEHRSLNELRITRDFLSHDKLVVVNAREASKQEIKNIQDSVSSYQQRVEQEKNRKRKMRRQTWFGRPGGGGGGGGAGFAD